jgi:ribosome-associated translation inhibitor RaiA
MQTPLQVDFQGVPKTPQIKDAIEKHVAQLEQRYGRVTSCRVSLRAPGGHHQNGGLYEVNIQLALPNGREVNIGRTAPADERHADLSFAINDAFKRARRRLQDNVRRLRGAVKQHDGPPTATVARLRRRSRNLFPLQQRARRRFLAPFGRSAGELRRGGRRERTAGEHGAGARQARIAHLTSDRPRYRHHRRCAGITPGLIFVAAIKQPLRYGFARTGAEAFS